MIFTANMMNVENFGWASPWKKENYVNKMKEIIDLLSQKNSGTSAAGDLTSTIKNAAFGATEGIYTEKIK